MCGRVRCRWVDNEEQRTEVCLSLVERMTYRRLDEIRGEKARYINKWPLGDRVRMGVRYVPGVWAHSDLEKCRARRSLAPMQVGDWRKVLGGMPGTC